jgi:hypothetical protein
MKTSWRIVGDSRVLASCSGCHYGVTFYRPSAASVFRHCHGQRETIPDEIIQKLRARELVVS